MNSIEMYNCSETGMWCQQYDTLPLPARSRQPQLARKLYGKQPAPLAVSDDVQAHSVRNEVTKHAYLTLRLETLQRAV